MSHSLDLVHSQNVVDGGVVVVVVVRFHQLPVAHYLEQEACDPVRLGQHEGLAVGGNLKIEEDSSGNAAAAVVVEVHHETVDPHPHPCARHSSCYSAAKVACCNSCFPPTAKGAVPCAVGVASGNSAHLAASDSATGGAAGCRWMATAGKRGSSRGGPSAEVVVGGPYLDWGPQIQDVGRHRDCGHLRRKALLGWAPSSWNWPSPSTGRTWDPPACPSPPWC